MKRRTLIAGSLAAMASGALLLRPAVHGGPHTPYFATLNDELRHQAPGRPLLLIDRERLLLNAEKIRKTLPQDKAFRIAAKSLPAAGLLNTVMQAMNTRRLMVFHQPHINAIATAFPDSDMLLGKPMPVTAAATFYQHLGNTTFNPARQLQWLIDSDARLQQYQQLAQTLGTKIRVNIEIDVGLHRGGLTSPHELKPLLDRIAADAAHLEFAGFMGYDAHVGKIPSIVESRDASFTDVCNRYKAFQDILDATHPELVTPTLTFNGGGSPTLRLHSDKRSRLNELTAGSCFVKPGDFDLELLADLQPAAFIATPVLKALSGTHIPGLGRSSDIFSLLNPNREKTYFIYGGLWMAHYESPPGLIDNSLYGKSSNQAFVNSSTRVPLRVDDWIFLRPTQSEKVLLEFGDIAVIDKGKVAQWWPVLPT